MPVAAPQHSARQEIPPEVSALLTALSDQEKMLIVLCEQLYEGRWDDMLQDLRDRLEGRPHVYEWGPLSPRLKSTITEHVAIISRLRDFEQAHGVNLARLIEREDTRSAE